MAFENTPLAVVVLAAGRGTRMQSDLPKVLHPIGQAPMLHHVLAGVKELSPERVIVVTGYRADLVETAARDFDEEVEIALQQEQRGTADALRAAAPALERFEGRVMVVFGDTPFVTEKTFRAVQSSQNSLVVLAFESAEPGRYGRVISHDGSVDKIVEAKDASPEELSVNLCNSGVMCGDWSVISSALASVDNRNASQEFYLTDIVQIARQAGVDVGVVTGSESEFLGVNSRAELAQAEAAFQSHRRRDLIDSGVLLEAPDTLFCAFDASVGRDARIEPYVVIGPGVTVESGAHIRAFSHLEGAHVSAGAIVGPYARLRPGAELAENVRIGNFVEVKNAEIATGAKVNHLSYIGDARIGEKSNIGAGTITCNYDGVFKHRTEIGRDVFVGSNTMLVAPVTLGDHAMTGSGSVITQDVPDGDLALSRARQVNKPGLGKRLMARLRALKASKKVG